MYKQEDASLYALLLGWDTSAVFLKTAQHYGYQCKRTNFTDNLFSEKQYYHVFLVSDEYPNAYSVAHKLSIQYPFSLVIVIIKNKENPLNYHENILFWHIYEFNEYNIYQMWHWIQYVSKLRLGGCKNEFMIANGILSLETESYSKNNQVTYLTHKQIGLLKLLLQHRGEVVSRTMILDSVWGNEKMVTDRVIDTNIVALRKIFEDNARNPKYLQTIFGQGYRLICD